jgi:transposase
MTQFSIYIGLDVHKDSISIAIAEEGREPARFLDSIPSDLGRLKKKLGPLGKPQEILVCYEAGPTGYGLYRWLLEQGYSCQVIAPSRTPRKAADRVKTDRRDAVRLAHFLRSGDLSAIRVPSAQEEAMRNLLRAREDAKRAEKTARKQLGSFLLRSGRVWEGKSNWTQKHIQWIGSQAFDHEADIRVLADYLSEVRRLKERIDDLTKSIEDLSRELECYPLIEAFQAFRGIQILLATWIAVEIGDFRRFPTAKHFMSFLGLTPSEMSSGGTVMRGRITKAGNVRLRSLLMQAAWAYRLTPRVEGTLRRRAQAASEETRETAWHAQKRLHAKYYRLTNAGKHKNKALVGVARELAGFIWSVGRAEQLTRAAA